MMRIAVIDHRRFAAPLPAVLAAPVVTARLSAAHRGAPGIGRPGGDG
jgi:hypothetical protein